ncbi:MAG TPA: phosphonate metabolism transcriptional regulator PhnF [Stellaceae bacterium]|nr:phosphonate metabolism transcriptional regulator PhnF [Stellaceae bacterium]
MTVLPFAEGVTRWRQIAEGLGEEIREARFPDGRLPTEPELAARFRVNRHTIRRAIGALADQGLVRVERGRGTFVASGHIDYLLGRRTRFSTNLRREGHAPSHRLLTARRVAPDAATARELRLSPAEEIIEIEALGHADDVPVSFAVHRFPAARFAALPEAFAASGSITAALSACGVSDYTREATRLLARLPSEREARYLEQSTTRPVLQTESVNIDGQGVPVQRSTTVFAGDRVQILVADGEGA